MGHLELIWSERIAKEAGTSWRPQQASAWWHSGDAVIASERAPRPAYEVYTYGHLIAIRPTITEARDVVESIYGPLQWRPERMPKVKIDHPLGATTEFTDPTTIYVVDHLPLLGAAASTRSNDG